MHYSNCNSLKYSANNRLILHLRLMKYADSATLTLTLVLNEVATHADMRFGYNCMLIRLHYDMINDF